MTKSAKLAVPIIIAFLLIVFGIYQLYQKRLKEEATSSPSPSIVGFPTPSIFSPSPIVLGSNAPSTQPASGSDTVEIKDVGIFIDSPKESQQVTSPLKISGRANVFDGNVQIRIKDSTGNIKGKGSARACLGLNACPFETYVTFQKPSTFSGIVELYSPNAVDGSEDYLQTINVIFQ